MATTPHLFCIGMGYSAHFISAKLQEKNWQISGTTRDENKFSALKQNNITPILWQSRQSVQSVQISLEQNGLLEKITHILISTPPTTDGHCPALDLVDIFIQMPALQHITYLSSTGVYGNFDGDWVDETTALTSQTKRGQARIAAEKSWQDILQPTKCIFSILRLSGIYGPARNAISSLQEQNRKNSNTISGQRVYKEGQVFNRVHVKDIAHIATTLFMHPPSNFNIYNIADDLPAPPQDVVAYAAQLLGTAPPPLIPLAEANLSLMGQSFYSENKRVRNHKVKQDLDLSLLYPTYKEGLEALLHYA